MFNFYLSFFYFRHHIKLIGFELLQFVNTTNYLNLQTTIFKQKRKKEKLMKNDFHTKLKVS